MRGSTKDLLAAATPTTVTRVLKVAHDRGWRDDSIRRHGNATIRAALDGTLVPARVRQPARQQRTVQDATERQRKPVKEQLLRVSLLRNGKTVDAYLEIGAARKKQAPSVGSTHDCGIAFGEADKPSWLKRQAYLFTLSVTAARRVVGGERIFVWLDGHSHTVTKHDVKVH